MLKSKSFDDLKRQLIPLLESSRNDGDVTLQRIWETFILHADVRAEEVRIGRSEANDGLPSDWIDDTAQDFAVGLYEKLLRCPNLGFDPEHTPNHFEGWIGTLIRNFFVSAGEVAASTAL